MFVSIQNRTTCDSHVFVSAITPQINKPKKEMLIRIGLNQPVSRTQSVPLALIVTSTSTSFHNKTNSLSDQ